MYNMSYEEYMQNLVGMQMNRMPMNQFQNNTEDFRNLYDDTFFNAYDRSGYQYNMEDNVDRFSNEIEECYPEIYRIIYPMVQKTCRENTRPISKEVIDEMVNSIYNSVESNEGIILNINLNNTVENSSSNRSVESKDNKVQESSRSSTSNTQDEKRDIESTSRQRPRNFLLNDLIRILILRELLGRPGVFPPFRPGLRPMPPRPMPRPRPMQFPRTTGLYNSQEDYLRF